MIGFKNISIVHLIFLLSFLLLQGCSDEAEDLLRQDFNSKSVSKNDTVSFIATQKNGTWYVQKKQFEIRDLKIHTSSSDVSKAEKLNGIEKRIYFELKGDAYRHRKIWGETPNKWSKWLDGDKVFWGYIVFAKDGEPQLIYIRNVYSQEVQYELSYPEDRYLN